MFRNHRSFYLFFFALVFLSSCAYKSALRKADEAYASGEYRIAAPLFSKVYGKLLDRQLLTDVSFRMAECYRITNQPKKAEVAFSRASRRGNANSLTLLYWAESLMKNQKYAEAQKIFEQYVEKVPGDVRGQAGLRSCRYISEWMSVKPEFTVEVDKNFSSRFNDFSPMVLAGSSQTVYFTSSREEALGKTIHGATGERFTDIFESSLDAQGNWSVPVPLNDPVSSVYEEGSCCFSSDGRTLFFTRCLQEKDKPFGSQIVSASLTFGQWGRERVLSLGDDTSVVAHPALSPDDLTLYFTANFPGGYGQKDLWMVTRQTEDDKWSAPVNLGPDINTPGDEVFPTVRSDGTLFFSSDGRDGFGGLDIYRAQRNGDRWEVVNVGYPLNSSADDFGMVFLSGFDEGYLSSSRSDRGDDDIYHFYKPQLQFNLVGTVIDVNTRRSLAGAVVSIVGNNGLRQEVQTDKSGIFIGVLRQNTDYLVMASRNGYLNGKGRESTRGREPSKNIPMTIMLTSTALPIELHNILYDLARWDLRAEALVSLDSLVEILNDNPGIVIELMSHTDSRGEPADNQILSQKRAQSVVDYLVMKGISAQRLRAQGYGESMPVQVDLELSQKYPFLRRGAYLSESYIQSLRDPEQQEQAYQINRRTEFRVIR